MSHSDYFEADPANQVFWVYGKAVPGKFEVCPRCEGRGRHVNPAVDGNGLSAEDIDENGPEFLEDYLSGVYDVKCEECRGEKVVLVLDERRATPEQIADFREVESERAEHEAEVLAERRHFARMSSCYP